MVGLVCVCVCEREREVELTTPTLVCRVLIFFPLSSVGMSPTAGGGALQSEAVFDLIEEGVKAVSFCLPPEVIFPSPYLPPSPKGWP